MTQQFTCNCCHQSARAREQAAWRTDLPPLIQVECTTPGCDNKDWTYTWRAGDDESNAQVLERYTPIETK